MADTELLPIWAEGGLGKRLADAMDDYRKEYVYSLDDHADHEPNKFEQGMLEDFLNGALSHGPVNDILQAAAMASAAPTSEQMADSRVKPLEWREWTGAQRGWQADNVLGQYQVSWLGEYEEWQLYSPGKSSTWAECFSRHPSSGEAKSAAQSDYEQRILSALTEGPPSTKKATIAREPNRSVLERLAHLWGYTLEETAEVYAVLVDEAEVPPSTPTSDMRDAEGQTLDERMKAAGMISLADLLAGNTPMEKWMAHTSVRDLDTFEQWVNMRNRELLTMRVGYELGDKPKEDELYEWVFAHSAAFGEVMANFRAMKERSTTPVPDDDRFFATEDNHELRRSGGDD